MTNEHIDDAARGREGVSRIMRKIEARLYALCKWMVRLVRGGDGDTRETMAEKLNMPSRTLKRWLEDPERWVTADFVVTVALLWRLPDWISALLLDRAYIHLSESNRRHLALQYILKVLWSEGVDKANEFLKEREMNVLTV